VDIPGIAVELLPMRLQYPPHTAHADVVLLSQPPASRTSLEGRDDLLNLSSSQPVGEPSLPEASSHSPYTLVW
jgi:hypothetical protein